MGYDAKSFSSTHNFSSPVSSSHDVDVCSGDPNKRTPPPLTLASAADLNIAYPGPHLAVSPANQFTIIVSFVFG